MLLYLDNAHRLDTFERESLEEAVEIAREDNSVGLVMTSQTNQACFAKILDDPRSLAEIQLRALKAAETLYGMQFYDSRFKSWNEAYARKEQEAYDLSADLHDHTDGNFTKMGQLRKSLAAHVPGGDLTLADVRRVIAIRTP